MPICLGGAIEIEADGYQPEVVIGIDSKLNETVEIEVELSKIKILKAKGKSIMASNMDNLGAVTDA